MRCCLCWSELDCASLRPATTPTSAHTCSCLLSLLMDTTSRSLASSKSGRSLRTTSPNSWSSRPRIVTVKLIRFT